MKHDILGGGWLDGLGLRVLLGFLCAFDLRGVFGIRLGLVVLNTRTQCCAKWVVLLVVGHRNDEIQRWRSCRKRMLDEGETSVERRLLCGNGRVIDNGDAQQ